MNDRITPQQSARLVSAEQSAIASADDRALRTWCALQAVDAHKAHPVDDIPQLAGDIYAFISGHYWEADQKR